MRRTLARALRALAGRLAPEEPAEAVYLSGDVPEYMLTPVLEAITRAAFERAWSCKKCGKLVAVSADFVRNANHESWAVCGPCSSRGWDV